MNIFDLEKSEAYDLAFQDFEIYENISLINEKVKNDPKLAAQAMICHLAFSLLAGKENCEEEDADQFETDCEDSAKWLFVNELGMLNRLYEVEVSPEVIAETKKEIEEIDLIHWAGFSLC